jgi:KipI family sensor histidine kinase inhibitor
MSDSTFPLIQPAGDSAVLVRLGDRIDPLVNRRVHALAVRIEDAGISGVVETVPAYASLLVHYDPLHLDYPVIANLLQEQLNQIGELRLPDPRRVEIFTRYGGEDGPDLAFVAEFHGLTEAQVVALHSEVKYQVYFIGFLPGFAYLGGLPDTLATPRLEKPRMQVPAGSVGIAGAQTGIYPCISPGGWRLIGMTEVVLFDPNRIPPALLAPGDLVRFVPLR